MANRVLVSAEDSMKDIAWLGAVEPFLLRVLSLLDLDSQELSVFFCTDPFMRQLNARYRGVDESTDVLSFENGECYTDETGQVWHALGDIIISLDMLPKNSAYFSVPEDEELKRLLVHGLLHLNGYDHGAEHIAPGVEPVCEMLKKQKQVLHDVQSETILRTL